MIEMLFLLPHFAVHRSRFQLKIGSLYEILLSKFYIWGTLTNKLLMIFFTYFPLLVTEKLLKLWILFYIIRILFSPLANPVRLFAFISILNQTAESKIERSALTYIPCPVGLKIRDILKIRLLTMQNNIFMSFFEIFISLM